MAVADEDRMPANIASQVVEFSSQVEKNGDQITIKNLTGGTQSSPNAYPNAFVFWNTNNTCYQVAHDVTDHSQVINFRSGINYNESLLSFEQSKFSCGNHMMKADEYSDWESDDHDHLINNSSNYNQYMNIDQISGRGRTDPRQGKDFNCFHSATNHASMTITPPAKEINQNKDHGSTSDWLYTEATVLAECIPESEMQEADTNKRPNLGESMQALKKQCVGTATKKHKPKSNPAKDPQSLAAKNRRERISERLKILQELVPSGNKVDLVTMLEKAISYVKFLQLQVKVLATDEFWPVAGGKAPDISKVREAIDAILSSQRERTSSSSNSGK